MESALGKTRVRWAHLTSPKGESFQGFWVMDAQGQPVHTRPYATRADARFIQELESRSMSSWTEAEMKRYNKITGQENQ